MAFDPTLPAPNSPKSSAVMRAQLNGLKALIDAILSVNAAQVDGVTTVAPGNPALASVAVVGNTLHFTFSIPQGIPGLQGQQGIQGNPGNDGAQGPPFAQAIVDAVNTLNPGDPATVSVSFDGTNVHFTFGLPRGADGAPGEVTTAQLATAIAGTSNNSSAVQTLDTPFINDPPSLADLEMMRSKYNELVLALRR